MEEQRPLSYAFNQENVKKFIDAIDDEETKKTIRTLLNNTKYVSYDEFVEQIKINTPQVLELVPSGRPIFIYIDNNKYDNFDHIESKYGPIDLITTADISLEEYLLGCSKEIQYIDGKMMDINIPAFQKEYYEIQGKGLFNGSLIINLCVKNIEKENWDNISNEDKAEMIRILKTLIK